MERGIVGRGEEKHFYYLDQPLLAQSTHKHKAEALGQHEIKIDFNNSQFHNLFYYYC